MPMLQVVRDLVCGVIRGVALFLTERPEHRSGTIDANLGFLDVC